MMETSQDIISCYPVIHMSLDLAWWRNSRSVGWRSDYEGHQTKEASKEFKILFIGIIYKATWKAMKRLGKHSSCCFVFQHFFTWGWDQKSMDFNLQWEEGLSQVATVPALSKPLFMLAALINRSPLFIPICGMADDGERCSSIDCEFQAIKSWNILRPAILCYHQVASSEVRSARLSPAAVSTSSNLC